MELKEVVAPFAAKKEKGIEIDLKGLSADASFRSLAVAAVLDIVKVKPQACILIPAYTTGNQNLGKLINELAQTRQVRTLVTGDVENLKRMRAANIKDVVLIKQTFHADHELADQVEAIKARGCKVQVLCFVSHCREMLNQFGEKHGVEISALLNTDEL